MRTCYVALGGRGHLLVVRGKADSADPRVLQVGGASQLDQGDVVVEGWVAVLRVHDHLLGWDRVLAAFIDVPIVFSDHNFVISRAPVFGAN